MSDANPEPGVEPDTIDLNDDGSVDRWAQELDVTAAQIREAVGAVGNRAADVEMHLKGSRSATNADRMDEVG